MINRKVIPLEHLDAISMDFDNVISVINAIPKLYEEWIADAP